MYYNIRIAPSLFPHRTAKFTLSHATADYPAKLLILLFLPFPFPFRISFTISARFAYWPLVAYTLLFEIPSIISLLQTQQSNGHCNSHFALRVCVFWLYEKVLSSRDLFLDLNTRPEPTLSRLSTRNQHAVKRQHTAGWRS